MHLHRIPGLSEQYLYFNDDIFPVGECKPEDFFVNGLPAIGYSTHILAANMYKKICRNSDRLARKVLGIKPSCRFIRPQHICDPMLKSECEKLYSLAEPQIRETAATRIRTEENLNQYLYMDYVYYQGKAVNRKISSKHFSLSVASPKQLTEFIANPTRNLVCINDVRLSEERYKLISKVLIDAFELKFPVKSRFER